MRQRHLALISTAILVILGQAASAQDHSGHAMPMATDLPAICLTNVGPMSEMAAPMAGAMPSPAHEALMAGMDQMNADMMAGGTATDIDVAFVCSMIPHHRGAISMAQAELANGDDEWVRKLAEGIIAAQEQEIADMLAWLDKQTQ